MPKLVLILLIAALSAEAGPIETEGRAHYRAAGCAACHRIGAHGSGIGPDLSFVGFRRGESWLKSWLENPQALKPDATMPRFALDLGTQRAIVSYLMSLQGESHASWDEEEDPVKKGREIFLVAGCAACHGPKGSGGQLNPGAPGGIIPALPKLLATYTRPELVEKISKGVKTSFLSSMPAWGERLHADELDALAVYLETLAERPAGTDDW